MACGGYGEAGSSEGWGVTVNLHRLDDLVERFVCAVERIADAMESQAYGDEPDEDEDAPPTRGGLDG